MPFTYDTYHNPYVGSIAELMQAPARAQAQAALTAGEAQARAAQQSGRAWGGAVQNIGQTVAGAIQQANDPRRQMEAMQIAEMKARQSGAAKVDQLMQGDQLPPGDAGPRRPSYTDANGLFDVPALNQELAKMGIGHLAPELLKGAEAINDSILKHQSLEQQAAQQKALMFGDMAAGAMKLSQMGMPVEQAMDFVVQPAIATKRITPQEYSQIRAQIVALPPDQQAAALGSFMDAASKLDKGKTIGKDSLEVDRYGRTLASNILPEKKPGYTINGQRFDGDGNPIGTAVPPQTAPKGLQTEKFRLDGKDVMGTFDPSTGKYLYNGQDVTPRAMPIPAASVQIYNKAVEDGKGDVSPQAKAIAEYRFPPPSPRSSASGAGKALMEQVLRANPDYSADQFSRRAPMARAFTSGPQSQAINSLNTAIGHLDQFVDVAKALDNGNFRPGNEAYNWLKATFGDSAPTNFEGIRSIMSGELASAFKKSGATDQEIASVEDAIASKNSTGQLVDYATTIAIPALGSKISTYNSQYQSVMGARDPFKVLTPDAEQVLQKYGFDPAHPKMGADGNRGRISVTAPDNSVHFFTTQAEADNFKALIAGAQKKGGK
jgi:hypothetical protein